MLLTDVLLGRSSARAPLPDPDLPGGATTAQPRAQTGAARARRPAQPARADRRSRGQHPVAQPTPA
jgi:hypothetical protein